LVGIGLPHRQTAVKLRSCAILTKIPPVSPQRQAVRQRFWQNCQADSHRHDGSPWVSAGMTLENTAFLPVFLLITIVRRATGLTFGTLFAHMFMHAEPLFSA